MNRNNLNIYCVEDNKDTIDNIDVADNSIKNKFKETLFNLVLCDKNEENTKYQISFVGFIHIKNNILLSLPKHFKQENKEEDLKLILKILLKYYPKIGLKENNEDFSNIPIDSYFYVINYYKKYGIYKNTYSEYKNSLDGNIDWTKTIKKSQEYINNNNIIYLSFIVKDKNYNENIISEVMKYVINDGYEQIGQFFNINIKLKTEKTIDIENNINFIINKLEEIKHNTYKDLTIKLINTLQQYLKWKNSNTEISFFLTKNFADFWEKMLIDYLNNNFIGINEKNKLLFKTNVKKYKFEEQKQIEYGNEHKLIFDYYCEPENENNIYLFDAKYYLELNKLDYKQIVYHYERIQYLKKNNYNKQIYNYLLLPNEEEKTEIHIDRTEQDNIKIFEHYFNIKSIMKSLI